MSSPSLPRDKRQKRAPDADADEGTNRRWRAAHRYGMPPSPELDCRPTLSATPLSWICGRGFVCTYSGNTQFLVVCLFLILTGGRGGWAFVLWPALERAGEAPARARGTRAPAPATAGPGDAGENPAAPDEGEVDAAMATATRTEAAVVTCRGDYQLALTAVQAAGTNPGARGGSPVPIPYP